MGIGGPWRGWERDGRWRGWRMTLATWAFLLGFPAAAIGCGYGSWRVVGGVAAAFGRGGPVQFHPREVQLVPLCLSFTCFSLMGLLPDTEMGQRPSRRSARARRAEKVLAALFGGAFAFMMATFPAPILGLVAVSAVASGRGYVACPPPEENRFGVRQWARSAAACRPDAR